MGERGKQVLVVDDEESLRRLVSVILETEGYAVDCAVDGEDALRKIASCCPDLVILDLMMPVLDGWGVLERLGGVRRPPVVILSAYADGPRALAAGAVGCVSKPFAFKEFLGVCEAALGS